MASRSSSHEQQKKKEQKEEMKIPRIFGSALIVASELTRTFRDALLRASSTPYDWRTLVTNNGTD